MTHGIELLGTRESSKACWTYLVLADLLFKLFAFVVLTPLLSLIFRCMLLLDGQTVLSDVEIAYFFAKPFGWLCAVIIGSAWLGILALEQSVLLAILAAASKGRRLSVIHALRFSVKNLLSILRVSSRLIALALLVVAPFLATASAVYYGLLDDHDINYYLKERPREFQIAVGIGSALLAVLLLAAIRSASGWFLALPLVLFDRAPSRRALQESSKLMKGHRLQVCLWISAWFIAGFMLQAVATFLLGGLGRWLLPRHASSLTLLAEKVGVILLAVFAVSVAINIAYTIGIAVLIFFGYRKWNPLASAAIEKTSLSGSKGSQALPELTRTRVTVAGILGVIFASLVGYMTLNSVRLDDNTLVMAHRGASKAAPENTLAAIRASIEARADWVEIDVQETADGEVVVIHDSDLMKLAKNKLKIWDATMVDLQAIDIGSGFDPRFASERVPTLSEVLTLCKGKIGVMIELKYYGHDQRLEERVAEIVDRHNMAGQVMVMSLKPEGVKKMKALRPDWKCGVLMSLAVGDLRRLQADFFAVNNKFATREFVKKVHAMNKRVYAWTVDDPATMSMLMNRGVDGIITNRPEITRQVLAQRFEMSASQRILTEIGALILSEPQSDPQ